MNSNDVIKELAEIKLIYCGTKDKALDFAIKAIKEKEADRWISVTERLPEEYGCYLVMWRSLTEGFPDRLFYEICEYEPEEDEWERIDQAGEAGAEIVAWMPLPERYEPKEKENEL